MIRPSLSIQNAANGDLLLDESRLSGLKFSTNSHGSASMSANFAMSMREGVRLLDRIGTPDIYISALGYPIWRGRLEDVEVTGSGISVTGFGYWRALLDQPYTALWSDKTYELWRNPTGSEIADSTTERYEFDNSARLSIAPRKNELMGSAKIGYWYYKIPHGSSRQIVAVSFDYSFSGETDWQIGLQRRDGSLAFLANQWTSTGAGVTQTGTRTETLTACDSVAIFLRYNAADANYAGETGITGLTISNIRIKTTSSSTVTPTAIISDVLSIAPALSSSTALIASNTIDLTQIIYEDRYPANILTELAERGDASGNKYEVGVDTYKRLYYRLQGARSKEWYITAQGIRLSRSMNALFNSVYAVYKDGNNRNARSSASTNTTSINRYGLTRKAFVTSDTTDANEAQYLRDVFLAASKDLMPRATFSVSQVYGVGINPVPPFLVQAGDYITITDLPPTPDNTLNKARRMRVTSTDYDCDTGRLTIEPEQPAPGGAPAFDPFAGVTPTGRRLDDRPRPENPVAPF